MSRAKKVMDASNARVRDCLEELGRKITDAQSRASMAGATGSSRSALEVMQLCGAELVAIGREIASVIAKYDRSKAYDYLDKFAELLNDTIDKIEAIFVARTKTAGEMLREKLHDNLVMAKENILREFDLASSATPPENKDVEDIGLAILHVYMKVPKQHKINVLGRTHQAGSLENEIGRKLSAEERTGAARILAKLLQDGLLEATYEDMADPENWLRITDAGREAVKRGAPDEIDARLMELDPRLVELRRGAWAAVHSHQPDAASHAAHSGRELVSQLLDILAPLDEVRSQPGFKPVKDSSSGVTRRMRIKYAVAKRGSGVSDSDVDIVEKGSAFLDALHNKLSAIAHSRSTRTRQEVLALLPTMETIILLLLFE